MKHNSYYFVIDVKLLSETYSDHSILLFRICLTAVLKFLILKV